TPRAALSVWAFLVVLAKQTSRSIVKWSARVGMATVSPPKITRPKRDADLRMEIYLEQKSWNRGSIFLIMAPGLLFGKEKGLCLAKELHAIEEEQDDGQRLVRSRTDWQSVLRLSSSRGRGNSHEAI